MLGAIQANGGVAASARAEPLGLRREEVDVMQTERGVAASARAEPLGQRREEVDVRQTGRGVAASARAEPPVSLRRGDGCALRVGRGVAASARAEPPGPWREFLSATQAIGAHGAAAVTEIGPGGDAVSQPPVDHRRVEHVRRLCLEYLHFDVGVTALTALVEEAYRYADQDYGIREAQQWGGDYKVPDTDVEEDEALLARHGGNVEAVMAERLAELQPSRLNHARIDSLRPDNPERGRLRGLVDGMEVPLPKGFVPNGTGAWPKLRTKYLQTAAAVDKMVMSLREKRLAFVFKKWTAATVKDIHLTPGDWTGKKGKEQGRNIIDSSDDKAGALNSDDAREAVRQLWGEIQHPTIGDLVVMILDYFDRQRALRPDLTWEHLVLYKMDLRGAFNLLSFRKDTAQYFATELVGGFVIIFLCGIFGWVGTPFAFQVVTRALKHEMRHKLRGASDMYVDDHIGVCLRAHLLQEQAMVRQTCTALLGEEAVADDKTEASTDHGEDRLDTIGYTICLRTQVVTISRKNFLKTFYGYFEVDVEEKVPVRTLERLASWGSRYAAICRWMRPFNRLVYASYSGLARHVSVHLTAGAKLAIRLWRAALCSLALDERRFARPMASFRGIPARHVVVFDACLYGTGCLVFSLDSTAGERLMGGSAASLAALEFGEVSDFQNTCEFLGVIMGLVTMRRLGIRDMVIGLRGDSVTALSWAESERYRGTNVTNASVLFTLMVLTWGVEVSFIHAIPGEDNSEADHLSRNPLTATMTTIGHPSSPHIDLNADPTVARLIRLCDPRTDMTSEEGFRAFWREASALIAAVDGAPVPRRV